MPRERIRVDPEALIELSAQVDQLAQAVGNAQAHLDPNDGLRSGPIEDALHHFGRDWSDRQNELAELLKAAGAILKATGENFRLVDAQLAQGMAGSTKTEASA